MYEVVGNHPVAGVDPGGKVVLKLPRANVDALVVAGHVAKAKPDHVCDVCGFEAKNDRGLSVHGRSHDSEDD